jgi:hypothetical protein
VEAITLDVWIFTPVPRWAPNVVVGDNDLEQGWSRDQENDGNTGDARIFRQVQASRRIIALCHVFLYCSWQLMWWLCFLDLSRLLIRVTLEVPLPLLLYPRGRGHKEGNRVDYNMIPIMTLSLLAYFVDI